MEKKVAFPAKKIIEYQLPFIDDTGLVASLACIEYRKLGTILRKYRHSCVQRGVRGGYEGSIPL